MSGAFFFRYRVHRRYLGAADHGSLDRKRNDCLGWGRSPVSNVFEHWRQILRRCTEFDTHANTFSDPNRDSHSNVNCYSNSNAERYCKTPSDGAASSDARTAPPLGTASDLKSLELGPTSKIEASA